MTATREGATRLLHEAMRLEGRWTPLRVRGLVGETRLHIDPKDADSDVVGVAKSGDVGHYLAAVAHSVVSDFGDRSASYERHEGTAPRTPPRRGDVPEFDLTLETISPGQAEFSAFAPVAGDRQHIDQVCSLLLEFSLAAAVQSLLGPSGGFSVIDRRSDATRTLGLPSGVLRARAHALIGPSGLAVARAVVADESSQIVLRGALTADSSPCSGKSSARARSS